MGHSQADLPGISIAKAAIMRGSRLVLRDFSLEAASGELVWIRGANGSGKSTLLRAIAGLLPLASGTLSLTGGVALTDDSIALDADRPLEDALRFWARLDRAGPNELETAMAALDLVPLAELPVRLLSAGQKRRGSLARMIASGAEIWLLDEPYNGLDQASVARLDTVLQRHAAAGGIALVASHIAPTVNVAHSVTLDRPFTKAAA
jgi:heme exporter protein A